MDKIRNRNRYRVIASILVTAIILSSVLSLPTSVKAISVSQSTTLTAYLVGASVPLPADINFIPSDNAPIKQVTLSILGPQGLTVDLPFAPGPFSITTTNSGVVSGTVAWENVGYGTGYGYDNPSGGTSRIRYNPLKWKTPILRLPAPPPAGASLPGWDFAFNVLDNQFVRGMGYDSSTNRLYVVVDSYPNDTIMILDLANPNNPVKTFNAPSNTVEAADYMGTGAMPGLYIADVEYYDPGNPNGKIYHYDSNSLAQSIPVPHHSFPAPAQIGGLANDGTNILAASSSPTTYFNFNYYSPLYKINVSTGGLVAWPGQGVAGPLLLNAPTGQPFNGGPLPPSQALAFYPANNNLLWSAGNYIARIDLGSYSPVVNPMVQSMEALNTIFVNGMAMVGDYVYMGGYEVSQPSQMKVFKARHPAAPPVDLTVAGDYKAQITVSGSTLAQGPEVNFALKKIGDTGQPSAVTVTINSPANNSAVQSTSVDVTGSVNDPSIASVSVGAAIGAQEFINDRVETVIVPTGSITNDIWQPSGMWHVSTDRSLDLTGTLPASIVQVANKKSWAYNQPNQYGGPPNYDNGQINSGFLETKNSYPISGESKMSFWTAWNTEPAQQFDKKLIEVNDGSGWQTVARIVEGFYGGPPPMFGGGFGGGYGGGGPAPLMPWGVDNAPLNMNADNPQQVVQLQVPQFLWKQVNLDFKGRFNGNSIKLRFKFDTVDPYANYQEGWYIDNIIFKGESALGGQTATVDSNLNFSTTVTIGEGANPITVEAKSGYYVALGSPGYLKATATNTVYLDTTAPAVTFNAVTSPTDSATQTVTGTIVETNLNSQSDTPAGVVMQQISDAGTKPLSPTLTGITGGKSFSMALNLVAGSNTIKVIATDKAGLSATKTALIVYDIIPPVINAGTTLYPVGEESARANDFFVLQADATDFGSGVAAVQLLMPVGGGGGGGGGGGLPAGVTETKLGTSDPSNEVTGDDGDTYQRIGGSLYKLLSFKKSTGIPQAIRTQWGQSVVAAATLTNGTGVATSNPVTAGVGSTTVNVTTAGSFNIAVPSEPQGITATVTSGSATVSGSPVTLSTNSANTVTTTSTGTFTISLTDNRWLMPMNLPSSAPIGTYTLTARAKDKDSGGNTASTTVSANVVSTLSKFNIYLMPGPDKNTPSVPGWNLISTPLIPNNTDISVVMAGLQAKGLQSVWYYDTATNIFKSYDPISTGNSLLTLETGKAYWVRMDTSKFSYDPQLATGLPETPRPVKLTISGQVLQAGNQAPPSYDIKAGWNMVGLHNEHDTPASTALAGLTSPFGARLWASLLEYKNYIKYPTQKGESPETVLGAFASVGINGNMKPGKGYWLFATADGKIVP